MLTSKQVIMSRPLSFSVDHIDYSTGPAKSEVKISDIIDQYIQQGSSDLFNLYLRDKLIGKDSLLSL